MTEASIHQEEIMILNLHELDNKASKPMKQKMIERQGK